MGKINASDLVACKLKKGEKLETGSYLIIRTNGKVQIAAYNSFTGWSYDPTTIKYYYLPKLK